VGQSVVGQPANKTSSLRPVYHSPLSISDQQILKYRLAVLEKRLQAAEKNLREANEELRELAVLAAKMFNKG
jgi:hypothetical protein